MHAPAVAIIGMTWIFPRHMPRLFPNSPKMKDFFAGKPEFAQRRACATAACKGPISSSRRGRWAWIAGRWAASTATGVDKEFFAGTNIKSNFICALGHGEPEGVLPRGPRLSFDEACKIIW